MAHQRVGVLDGVRRRKVVRVARALLGNVEPGVGRQRHAPLGRRVGLRRRRTQAPRGCVRATHGLAQRIGAARRTRARPQKAQASRPTGRNVSSSSSSSSSAFPAAARRPNGTGRSAARYSQPAAATTPSLCQGRPGSGPAAASCWFSGSRTVQGADPGATTVRWSGAASTVTAAVAVAVAAAGTPTATVHCCTKGSSCTATGHAGRAASCGVRACMTSCGLAPAASSASGFGRSAVRLAFGRRVTAKTSLPPAAWAHGVGDVWNEVATATKRCTVHDGAHSLVPRVLARCEAATLLPMKPRSPVGHARLPHDP